MTVRSRRLLAGALVLIPVIAVGLLLAWPRDDDADIGPPDGGTTEQPSTLPLLGTAGDVPRQGVGDRADHVHEPGRPAFPARPGPTWVEVLPPGAGTLVPPNP